MSKFAKSHLMVDGDNIHVSMPFAKVNKSKRTVSGFATLDNIDQEGDVVTAEASLKAFTRARGNLREMHEKIAAGRVIDFREDEYYDPEDKAFYKGIFVTAYVSKGAESTWEKVLDGTLSGFSIGGEVKDASNDFVKEAGRTVRFIKDYDLVELSLVDNPANQLANIKSFEKMAGFEKDASGSVNVTGLITETKAENVFICPTDFTVLVKGVDSETCPTCEVSMTNAGWIESGQDRAEKVQSIVSKFLGGNDKEVTPSIAKSEGGVEEVANKDNNEEVVVEGPPAETESGVVEVNDTNAETGAEPETETEVEKVETVEEVVDDEAEVIAKRIEDLHNAVKDSLTKSQKETKESLESITKRLDELDEKFDSRTSELSEKLGGFEEKLETAKARYIELERSLEKMNSAGAGRKSGELDSPVPMEKNHTTDWHGAFSPK